jgi:hypothetical protein
VQPFREQGVNQGGQSFPEKFDQSSKRQTFSEKTTALFVLPLSLYKNIYQSKTKKGSFMKRKRICQTIAVLVICLFTMSCSSRKIPEGFPSKLVPFRVTLRNEGKPVSGASVALVAETSQAYSVIAHTDQNGDAPFATSVNTYSKTGVPPGVYKAIITHIPKAPSELPSEQRGKMSMEESEAYGVKISAEIAAMPKIVPASWGNLKNTPIKITVPESGGNAVIEITDSKTYTSD